MSSLFLGFDCSTQSLGAMVIDLDTSKIIYEKSLCFDEVLPQFGTEKGVLPNSNPLIKESSPLLWAAALDLLLLQMQKEKIALDKILAISGSAQQHGSVYLNAKAAAVFAHLDPKKSLVDNLNGIFTRERSPIWMDSSTTEECEEIRSALGGMKAVASLTGSDVFERFTGAQIRKFYKSKPKAYDATTQIVLISSFMASLLSGTIAPIDFGDGAGMNLMDIRKKEWNRRALDATAPNLLEKLPRLANAGRPIGPVHDYFVKKFGLNPKALVTVWTGDNPASIIGLGLTKPGQVAISLGTSDTLFAAMAEYRTNEHGEGHIFCSPAGGYMALICFKNGSLAREKVRELYSIPDWQEFGKLIESTAIGNKGAILLPWFEKEIIPRINKPGFHRFDLDEKDVAANCRAIFEGQMLSMRLHSEWIHAAPQQIFATGGASNNPQLLQIMANVMNCPVLRIEVSNSTELGAALIAAHGFLSANDKTLAWDKLCAEFTKPILGSQINPDKKGVAIYEALLGKYAACERLFST
jgi:xylulokinase